MSTNLRPYISRSQLKVAMSSRELVILHISWKVKSVAWLAGVCRRRGAGNSGARERRGRESGKGGVQRGEGKTKSVGRSGARDPPSPSGSLRTLATQAMKSMCELRIKDESCQTLSQLFTKFNQFIYVSDFEPYTFLPYTSCIAK